jgi:hypothetical protein
MLNYETFQQSTLLANNIEEKIKLGMTFRDIVSVLGVKPQKLGHGTYVFLLNDGKLMTRFSGDNEMSAKLLLWKSFILLPNGKMLLEADSKQQSIELMKNNPICLSVEIAVSMSRTADSTGYCYYEQFSPDNIYIKALGEDAEIQMYFIKGAFLFVKGDVENQDVLKYLTGYIANLNLLQSLLGEGMAKSALDDQENGNKRHFSIICKNKPLMILSLNKKLVYPAPWDMKGFLIPIKNKKGYNFDLTMTVLWTQMHSVPVIQKTKFKGYFIQEQKQLAKNIDFSSWRQFALSGQGQDLSLTPLPENVSNIDELPYFE